MTVHYPQFAVPVDPEFARELKAQLDARRVRQQGSPKPADDQATPRTPITEVTLMLQPAKQPDHRWRRVGLMAAAGIAVLATGTVLVLTTANDDADLQPAATVPPATVPPPATVAPPAAPDPQEAVGLAQRFVEARDSWDGEAVRALVADDALIDDHAVENADDYLRVAAVEQATGWRYLQPDCTATVSDAPVEVTCTYTMENAWSQAIGVGPFTGSSFDFVVADGQIQQIAHHFNYTVFEPQVYAVFGRWLTATYPNDVEVMFNSNATFRLTPESVALFEAHTTEFISSLNNPGSG